MEKHLRALSFQKKNVGKMIKSSKKLYIWNLMINGKLNLIELYVSKFSGKRTLKINGEIKSSGKKLIKDPIFISEGVHCCVYSNGKNFQVSINGVAFDQLKRGSLKEQPLILVCIQHWEDKAKPFGRVSDLNGSREKFPIIKKDVKANQNLSRAFLSVPLEKPRSSSHKEKIINSELDLFS